MKYLRDKTRWLVVVVAMMALPSMAEVRDTVDFDFLARTYENITVGNETFVRYSFPGCDHIDQVGAPMLPVKYIRLSVPYNATNITVKPLCSWTPATENKREYPAPVPLTTNDTITEPELVIDSAIYMTDAYWPPAAAELVGEGFYMGENHIVTVAVYPMLYNPVQNKMHNYTQVRVKVSYDLGGTPANMLVRYDSRLRQQEQQQAKSLVDNPQLVEAHAMPASTVHHMMMLQNPDTTNWPVPGYEYMVITTRELAPAFKRLIALKQQKGYRAGVVCVEDIVTDSLVQNGDECMLPDSTYSYINDDAGKIRQYLRENRYYGTKFVLLAGKSVPFRYGWNAIVLKSDSYTTEVPTDLYFSDLNTNWNKDNDNLYGEKHQYGDTLLYAKFDFDPDLYIGRLMCKNEREIESYSKKLLCYELYPGHGNFDYLTKAFYFQHKQMKGEANVVHSSLKNVIADSTLINENRAMEYPKGKDIIDILNNDPHGFISLHTHGNPGHMTTSYNNYNGRVVKYCIQALDTQNVMEPHSWQFQEEIGNGLDNLLNITKPNVLYTIACDVTPFDVYAEKSYSPPYVYNTIMNFGESFTLGNDYGGVAFLGNTRSGLVGTSAQLEKCFAEQLVQKRYKAGIAEAISKSRFNSRYYRLYINMIHNLIGDPEFEIWTSQPQPFNNISIMRSENFISICNHNQDNMFYVGLNDGIKQFVDSTNTGSTVIYDVNPNSTVVLYRHNYLPYIAPLFLQNERIERSQYVIANDVFAGRNVDSNRTAGDLTIAAGSEFEIETKGQVVLTPGFTVEKGALFSVTRSDY